MRRRELPEINAGSMADIAFLLLIFFLVATTMDTDMGLLKKLSRPAPDDYDPPEVRERNILVVLVKRNYDKISKEQVAAINDAIPVVISEAEPNRIGK